MRRRRKRREEDDAMARERERREREGREARVLGGFSEVVYMVDKQYLKKKKKN